MARKKKISDSEQHGQEVMGEILYETATKAVERVEYFDDRFYKIDVAEDYFQQFCKNVPERLTEQVGELRYLYLPSVTTYLGLIIDPYLARWRGDVGNERADWISWKARDLGSEIHELIDARLRGFPVAFVKRGFNVADYPPTTRFTYTQDVAVQLARFEKLLEVLKPNILFSEMTVFNLAELYAGTADQMWSFNEPTSYKQGRSVIELESGRYVIDIKTGRNINDTSYFAQLSAYCNSDTFKHFDVKGAIILHLNANIKGGIEGAKIYVKTSEELKRYYQYFLNVKGAYLFDNEIEPKKYSIPTFFDKQLR